jgi:hypothetical protein
MKQYQVALPLTEQFKQQIIELNQKFLAQGKEPLSNEAGKLMSDVSCQIIDVVFKRMVEQFLLVPELPASKKVHFDESLKHIEDIKGVMRKYMTWAISFFGNDRLKPVVAFFYGMIQQKDHQSYLVFDLPECTAQRALLALNTLETGKVDTAEGAIESLIEVTDIGVDTLIKQPKELLKFNFVVNKTLNGVINMTTSMAYGHLRRFGKQLDPVLFETTASHLQQFLQKQ